MLEDSDDRPPLATVNQSLRRPNLVEQGARARAAGDSDLPRTRKTRPDGAPATANPILNEEPAPEKIDNTGEGKDENRAVDPAPISMTPDQQTLSPSPANEETQNFDTLSEEPVAAPGFVPTEQHAPLAEAVDGNKDHFMELDDPDDVDEEHCVTYREFLTEIAATEAAEDPRIAKLLGELDEGGLICR